MNKKIIIIGMLLITMLVFVSCVSYTAPTEEVELVDEALVDVDEAVIDGTEDTNLEDETDVLEDTTEEETVEDVELVVEETVELEESVPETIQNDNAITIAVDEDDLVDLNAVVTDPDEDEVTYFFSEPLTESGSWKTNYGDAGEYEVTLTATDGVNTVEQLVLLVVNRVNVAPAIESLRDLFYAEGDDISFEPVVTDPNGDSVTVTVSGPLATGEFETDHTSAGEYEITVLATDGELDSEKTFTLTIEDINVLPVISGIEDLEVSEGETVELDVSVEDLDGDEVVVTISDPIGNDGVWDVSFTDNGEYQITVTVDDGKDVVTETINIIVGDINMPPEIIDVSLDTE
ncbi:hypothetical protein HOA92_03615 [archaeon]|jgi:hypothetical protein|nr:hypothetical protein [archaeon]MBT6762100.1 hypothetical protein [archaeon]